MTQGQDRVSRRQFREIFQEGAVLVGPAAIVLLPLLEGVEQFLPPVVFFAGGVFELSSPRASMALAKVW